MEPEGSLPLYKIRPPIPVLNSVGDFSQNGGIFSFNNYEKETVVIVHDIKSQMFINISDYRAAALYSETEVQVFPKQLSPQVRKARWAGLSH